MKKGSWLLYRIAYVMVMFELTLSIPDKVQQTCVKACLKLVTPSLKVVEDTHCSTLRNDSYSEDEREQCDHICGDILRNFCNQTGSCLFESSLETPSSPLFSFSDFTSITLQWNLYNSKPASRQVAFYVLQLESNQTKHSLWEILPFVPRYSFVNGSNSSNPVTHTVRNLPGKTKYRFRLSSIGPGGVSSYSNWSAWFGTNETCRKTTATIITYEQWRRSEKNITYPCPATRLKLNVSLKVVYKKPVVLDAILYWKNPPDLKILQGDVNLKVTVKLVKDKNAIINDLCKGFHEVDFSDTLQISSEDFGSFRLKSVTEVGKVKKSIHFGCKYSVMIKAGAADKRNSFETTAEFRIPECLDGVKSCPIPKISPHIHGSASSRHINTKISQDKNGFYTTNIIWSLDAWKDRPEVEFFHITVEEWPRMSKGFYNTADVNTTQGISVYHRVSFNMSEGKTYRVVVRAYHGKNCIHDVVERETFKIIKPCNGNCTVNATCLPKNSYDGTASCKCNKGFSGNGTFCTVMPKPCNGYCAVNATCLPKNTYDGTASCKCNKGFTGNGTFCTVVHVPQALIGGKDDSIVAAIVVPIVLVVILILLIGGLLWRRWGKRKRIAHQLINQMPASPLNSNLYQHFPSTRRRSADGDIPMKNVVELPDQREVNVIYVPQEIQHAIAIGLTDGYEFNAEQLKLGACLGKGAFGNVYCAEARGIGTDPGWTEVAVKTLSESHKGADDFIEEIQLMKKLGEHENVITMLGCCTLSLPICLILEYAPYGNLLNYLRTLRNKLEGNNMQENVSEENDHKLSHEQTEKDEKDSAAKMEAFSEPVSDFHDIDGVIESSELESFALQISKGMAYVAGQGIVHRDLAARNVLIGYDRTLKISDFGLSREGVYVKTTSGKIPLRWLSVEAIRERSYSTASDVWAFGIVLWEICTLGGFPYPAVSDRDLLKFLLSGNRLEKPSNCTNEIYAIMMDCWSNMPEDRPTFAKLRDLLWKLKNNEDPYVNIDPLQDYYFPPTDEGSLNGDSLETTSPGDGLDSVSKLESPKKTGSQNSKAGEGMPNPGFRPIQPSLDQDSDDSNSKEEQESILKNELEDDIASSSC